MIGRVETAPKGRPLRRLALSLVPVPQLRRLRTLYEHVTTPGVRVRGDVKAEGSALRVSMQSPAVRSFLVVPDSQWTVEGHLSHPRQSAELAAFIAEAATPGLLLDIGANDGLFSMLYCLGHPANHALGFEPSSPLCERFQRNATLNNLSERMNVRPLAVADRAGRQTMLSSANDGYVQVTGYSGTGASQWHETVIETTTLDAQSATCQPTVVKIDVEGFELEVLQGASVMLTRIRPVVFLELHLNFLEERGIAPAAVIRELREHDYDIYDLSGRAVSDRKAVRSWAPAVHLIGRPRAGGRQQRT